MKVTTVLFSMFVLFAFNSMLYAQESQVSVKVVKDVNGVKTVMDTTITTISSDGNVNIEAVLKELGVENVNVHMMEGENADFNVNVDIEGLDEETKATIHAAMEEHGEGKEMKMVFISKDGETTEMNGEHMDMKVIEWNSEEGEEFNMENLDEETREQLEEAGINIDELIMKHPEGEKMEMRVIKIGDDIATVDILGDPETKEIKVFVQSDGEMDENMSNEVSVDVDENKWVGDDGETRIVKTVKVAIFMRDLEDEDKVVLKRSGVEVGSLENSLKMEQLSFYPNPSNGRFNLSFNAPEAGDVHITVVNAEGKRVYEEKLANFSGEYQKEVNLTGNASGVYFLNLLQNGRVLNKKLVLK